MRAVPPAPAMLSVLRIVAGLLFLAHGTQKFLSFPAGRAAGIGLRFNSMPAFAGIIELVCGLLIAIGLFTRAAAFLASGTMAVAYLVLRIAAATTPSRSTMAATRRSSIASSSSISVFAGPGPWSIDAARAHRNPPRP